MLHVKSPEEVLALIETEFAPLARPAEKLALHRALGRILAQDVAAREYVPDFDRSTVDGYALRARDTFGCSEAIPAILPVCGQVLMGQSADFALPPGSCCAVPTGGALPRDADCVVMLEYAEDYGDASIGVCKAVAPGENVIFRGDDVAPGKTILAQGRLLSAQDIGALAALGQVEVTAFRKLRVAVLSTGDELTPAEAQPGPGQIRDVNAPMLAAILSGFGAEPVLYGIVPDDEKLLRRVVAEALAACDSVLISGGSSVGLKDVTCRIIEEQGQLLLHGIAIKPGKPTILGKSGGKALVGLPGHPLAACFVTRLFVLPLLARLEGRAWTPRTVEAELAQNVGANHGRAQVMGCRLAEENGRLSALPIHAKSGLITSMAGADGFFTIDRDCEGLPKGARVRVILCMGD